VLNAAVTVMQWTGALAIDYCVGSGSLGFFEGQGAAEGGSNGNEVSGLYPSMLPAPTAVHNVQTVPETARSETSGLLRTRFACRHFAPDTLDSPQHQQRALIPIVVEDVELRAAIAGTAPCVCCTDHNHSSLSTAHLQACSEHLHARCNS
jgi:hypothetical protein